MPALAARGIRVNAIAPGSIEFPGAPWEQRRQHEHWRYRHVAGQVPFGRPDMAKKVAHAAMFLASPWANRITGKRWPSTAGNCRVQTTLSGAGASGAEVLG